MTEEQNHQELVDLKVLLKECFIAECELGSFLLDKAKATDFSVDDHFKLKHLSDRVLCLIREIQQSDERPPVKLPVYPPRGYLQACARRGYAILVLTKTRPLGVSCGVPWQQTTFWYLKN
jgi:hypothetical protein